MRLSPRRSLRPILIALGLLLLLYAIWGLYRSYPDFDALRAERADVRIPPPAITATP